mmetsp:Transcript_93449/g.269923  ORF Transcript_93449/g.269923 Transcript_93449/m.269923 type:complete len:412 (-) Transcript_93449:10-1245(-)
MCTSRRWRRAKRHCRLRSRCREASRFGSPHSGRMSTARWAASPPIGRRRSGTSSGSSPTYGGQTAGTTSSLPAEPPTTKALRRASRFARRRRRSRRRSRNRRSADRRRCSATGAWTTSPMPSARAPPRRPRDQRCCRRGDTEPWPWISPGSTASRFPPSLTRSPSGSGGSRDRPPPRRCCRRWRRSRRCGASHGRRKTMSSKIPSITPPSPMSPSSATAPRASPATASGFSRRRLSTTWPRSPSPAHRPTTQVVTRSTRRSGCSTPGTASTLMSERTPTSVRREQAARWPQGSASPCPASCVAPTACCTCSSPTGEAGSSTTSPATGRCASVLERYPPLVSLFAAAPWGRLRGAAAVLWSSRRRRPQANGGRAADFATPGGCREAARCADPALPLRVPARCSLGVSDCDPV